MSMVLWVGCMSNIIPALAFSILFVRSRIGATGSMCTALDRTMSTQDTLTDLFGIAHSTRATELSIRMAAAAYKKCCLAPEDGRRGAVQYPATTQ